MKHVYIEDARSVVETVVMGTTEQDWKNTVKGNKMQKQEKWTTWSFVLQNNGLFRYQ